MKIEVKLYSIFKKYSPNKRDSLLLLEVEEGSTVEGIMKRLGLPWREDVLILVNGKRAEPNMVLSAGDKLSILPPLSGG